MKYSLFLLAVLLAVGLCGSAPTEPDPICIVCTRELLPVCGRDGDTTRTFSNRCVLEKTNACTKTNFVMLHVGECGKPWSKPASQRV